MALLLRTLRLYMRDPAVYTFRFMLYGFMSFFLGITYYRYLLIIIINMPMPVQQIVYTSSESYWYSLTAVSLNALCTHMTLADKVWRTFDRLATHGSRMIGCRYFARM
jgi:hypothetical protein